MLTRCEWCSYSLAGMPPRGRCPECGRVYDVTWEYVSPRTHERTREFAAWVWSYAPTARTVAIVVCILAISGAVIGLGLHGIAEFRGMLEREFGPSGCGF